MNTKKRIEVAVNSSEAPHGASFKKPIPRRRKKKPDNSMDILTPKPGQVSPIYQQLKTFYLKRNGLPLSLRARYKQPFNGNAGFYQVFRYQALQRNVFQCAVEHYSAKWDSKPFQTFVHYDNYPLLYGLYCPGNIRFHSCDNSWKSKVLQNPTYGNAILCANQYGLDIGEPYVDFHLYTDWEPDYVSGEPDIDGAMGVYLYT